MNRISMQGAGFDEETILERTVVRNPEYNTRIIRPENCEVVIISHDGVQRMKSLDGSLLNPQPHRLRQLPCPLKLKFPVKQPP